MRTGLGWTGVLNLLAAGAATVIFAVACSGPRLSGAASEPGAEVAEVPVETEPPAADANGVDLNSLIWEYTVIDEDGREMIGEEAIRYLASKGTPEPILKAVSDGRPFPDDLQASDADDDEWRRINIRITIKGTVPIKPKAVEQEQPFRF